MSKESPLGHANSKWMNRLAHDPNWKLITLRKAVKRDWTVEVSNKQCYRAKRGALQVVQGNHRKQYWNHWDYFEKIRRLNHGSRSKALLKVERLHSIMHLFS